MSRNERFRDKYPAMYAYGGHHEFLDTEAAIAATTEERIRSIWPFIVRRVRAFSESLKPREQVNFDPEDVLTELWVALAEKDGEWTPDRGKYITFAGVIIDRELCSVRDKARTVQSPRNSSCRMKKYRQEAEAGTLTKRREKTANDIRRTGDGPKEIVAGGFYEAATSSDPSSAITATEAKAERVDAVKTVIRKLSPFEALVVGRLVGLWGQPPSSVWRISWETGRDQTEVRRAKERAMLKIRKHLVSINHPVSAS